MKTRDEQKLWLVRGLLLLCCIEGGIAIRMLFNVPSESESIYVLGLSQGRFIFFLLSLAVLCFYLVCFCISLTPELKSVRVAVLRFLNKQPVTLIFICLCWAVFLLTGAIFLYMLTPARLMNTLVPALVERTWGVLLWMFLCSVQSFFILSLCTGRFHKDRDILTSALLFSIFAIVYAVFTSYYDSVDWNRRFDNLELVVMLPVICALLGAALSVVPSTKKVANVFLTLFIGSLAFAVYRSSGEWMGRWNTPSKAYWDQLAQAFLDGQLYLSAPATVHDLTAYNGHWYVPNPPLPAILLIPFVLLNQSPDGVNMMIFSAAIGAINVVLVFQMLQQAAKRGLTNCTLSANLWLTAIFALGTNHWWLCCMGQMWFTSQLVTVTFLTAACLSVMCGRSGWLSGLLFGLALLARPNVFPCVFFLAGLWLFISAPYAEIPWKRLLGWAVKVAIPALLCVGLLLGYNRLRFENWFDFGYVTINGADWIIEAVRQYGMFNLHFVPLNFRVMLLQLPVLDFSGSGFFFQPGVIGFSIFAMTPSLLYLVKGFSRSWAGLGAWISVLLTLGLLLCYHNTGAEQVGYRYLMDCIAPVMLLLAIGVREKAGLLFRILAVLSFCVNGLSIYWWFLVRV